VSYLLAVLHGSLAGVLAGMFGVGGGVLFVPVLLVALSLSQKDASGTRARRCSRFFPRQSPARVGKPATATSHGGLR